MKKKNKWQQALKYAINDQTKKDNILIIDGMNLFIRSFSVVPSTTEYGEHVGGITGSLKSLRYVIKHLNPSRCFIIFDGKGGSQRRRKIFKEYKNNRKGMKGLNRTIKWNSLDQEEKSCKLQLQKFIEMLQYLPVTTLVADNIEADDAIAFISSLFNEDKNCIIVSSDKDFLQLVSDKINIWMPTKKKLYDVNKVKEDFILHPNNILLWRIIEGDPSDNIPGIKGVGFKTILKYLENDITEDRKISLEEFYEWIDKLYDENSNSKKIKTLYENKDILERNYKLMNLQEVNISGTSKSLLIERVRHEKIPTLNQIRLRTLFMKNRLYTQIKNFSSWYFTFNYLNAKALNFNKKLK